jgi:L-arabinose isomerase
MEKVNMNPRESAPIKVGLFGIGLDTYWPQFTGLKDRLEGYQAFIHQKMETSGAAVVDAGLVDCVEKAHQAAGLFASERVEIIFLYISTYALSSTVLPVVQQVKAPVVVLNLQPEARIDYEQFNRLPSREAMTGEWLAHCQACCTPEIASVFRRTGVDYHLVTGVLDNEDSWREIRAWVEAARVKAVLREASIGLLGHYYCGMLDVYSDYTRLAGVFGTRFVIAEMDELAALRRGVEEAELQAMLGLFRDSFDVDPECSEGDLRRAALTSCALHRLVEKHGLGFMAYYYEGQPGSEHEDIVSSVIAGNTLLTAHHVPVAGEFEIKNAFAMKIMDSFGAGGSFSEFYAMDFVDDVVLLGHDGPAHAAIAEGRVQLVPLRVFHGKPGQGLSIQMSVKHGPVTLLSVLQEKDGSVKLLAAEGQAEAGPVMMIGNTNSRYRFLVGAKGFVNAWAGAGPSHHCAIGVGHTAEKIEKLASLLGIEVIRVC